MSKATGRIAVAVLVCAALSLGGFVGVAGGDHDEEGNYGSEPGLDASIEAHRAATGRTTATAT